MSQKPTKYYTSDGAQITLIHRADDYNPKCAAMHFITPKAKFQSFIWEKKHLLISCEVVCSYL